MIFCEKNGEKFAETENVRIFAPVKKYGRVAQLNRVADYGSAGYRFESCRDHKALQDCSCGDFCLICPSIFLIRVLVLP